MSKSTHSFVLVGGDQQRLTVKTTGRIRPDSTNADDGNWLRASVEIQAGRFSGAANCSLRTEDLAEFRQGLARLTDDRSATAAFKTMEDHLGIAIVGDGHGGMSIKCHVADSDHRLACQFRGDQGNLPKVLEALDRLLEAYPVA